MSSTSPPLADENRELHVARLENRHAVGRRFDRMDQHLSTARYARENTVSQRSVRATCLLFEESEALLHRHLCLEQGVSKSPVRIGDDRRVVRRAVRFAITLLSNACSNTRFDGEERGSPPRLQLCSSQKTKQKSTRMALRGCLDSAEHPSRRPACWVAKRRNTTPSAIAACITC